MKQGCAGAHCRLEIDDRPVASTVARPGRALPGPEEGLVDLLLRNAADLHLVDHRVDEIDFRF